MLGDFEDQNDMIIPDYKMLLFGIACFLIANMCLLEWVGDEYYKGLINCLFWRRLIDQLLGKQVDIFFAIVWCINIHYKIIRMKNFSIIGKIGEGAYSAVYRARRISDY